MADTEASTTPTGPASPRGGRRGGRRGGFGHTNDSVGPQRSRGRGGQRGGGRGSGGPRAQRIDDPNNGEDIEHNGGQVPASHNGMPDIAQKIGQVKIQDSEETPTEADGDICFICASPVVHWAVAPCNHRTCHICALRLRALYKSKSCAHCRTPSDFVIFTDDAEKEYKAYSDGDMAQENDTFGIKFEKPDIYEDTVLLLRFNCPDSSCDVACLGWPDLRRHVKNVHHKEMCELCTRNKKVFTHEHELFSHNELRKHQRFGDDNPGAVDQSGFKGHPECGFCRQRFYGDDELYTHCRDRHERCHICDRRNEGRQHQYYQDYDALEQHFRKDHFLCPEQECLDKKFTVFESEMDLKAHQLEAHPHGLSGAARRDARRVDMSGFDYRTSYQPRQENRREGRGRGRGRDPNAEPLPPSSAQPMRRDEIAYQRQMAIHSAQSVAPRTFGGQLTTSGDAFAARPAPSRPQEQDTVTASQPRGAARGGEAFPARTTENSMRELTPQEQARQLRHNAVIDRARGLLKADEAKMAEFKTKVSAYKNGALNAAELVDGFFTLFDTSSADLGKLVMELAEIFELPTKKDALIRAWKEWKAINEDFPTLAGAPSSNSSGTTFGGGSRVLKLKSSTAQSSRSAVSRQAGWGTASSASSTPMANNFPALASANASLAHRSIGARPGATPWSNSVTNSTNNSARPSPQPSRTASSTNVNRSKPPVGKDAFPELPKAAKPTTSLFTPGLNSRGIIRVNTPNANVNAWGPPSAGASGANTPNVGDGEEGAQGGRKKGGKKGKQILFQFG